jgi:hypothetical protein
MGAGDLLRSVGNSVGKAINDLGSAAESGADQGLGAVSNAGDQIANYAANTFEQAIGVSLQQFETLQEPSIANLGQSLATLDARLGTSQETSMVTTMQTLLKEANQETGEARIGAKANALVMIAEKSALALDKLQGLDGAQQSAQSGFITGAVVGDLTAVLMEFQKMAGAEMRGDAKTTTMMKEFVEQQKSANLANDNKQIDQQMSEANEKANNLMDAATTSLVTGIVASATQVLGGISSGQATSQPAGTIADRLSPGMLNLGAAVGFDDLKLQVPVGDDAGSEAQELKQRANDMEIQANARQTEADKADEAKKNSADHNKTIKDAVRKMLEQIAELNRATNF